MKTYKSWLVALCALVITLWIADSTIAQVKKGKTRPALTKQLMKGLVKPHCGNVKKALKSGIKNDKGWEALEVEAALLNESSFILMADGRCPDATWKAACDQLREGSVALLASIKKKDADGAQAAFGATTKACGTCHKAHKK